MAETSGMAEIRGIDIDKLAKGFADEEIIFKRWVTLSTTSAREIRWYQKTSGILNSTATTGMPVTASQLDGVAELALPDVVEQSWTRDTSYVRKYFVESPIISDADIKDTDIDILATNIRDLTRAIARRVDTRIWEVLTEARAITGQTINYRACSGAWTDGSGVAYPIHDLMTAKQLIRTDGYNPEGGVLMLTPIGHSNLLKWLINIKGAAIPSFSSARVGDGVVQEILGLNVIVSENVTAGYGLVGNTKRACTWKSFTPITARTIEEVGIGTKIRVWERGEAILTDPEAVCLLSGCGTS